MPARLTYRRRHSYNTASNKVKKVKTPGGRLVFHYATKVANGPSCGDCGCRLQGIASLRPKEYRRLKQRERTVSRAYGGSRCSTCVRERIIRAFLVEEQKIVKSVLRQRAQQKKTEEKKKPAKKKA